ncbi:hypothetical protein C1645_838457 [Glomus cerebriforme]|uniref:Protein kinase domain-containing protein n=1 Tax=Glomus cerebriforme TaxID=658196 RepID=A0A397S9A5_9GLOM|nr:hypothetical protein C1645_838457 [Glomus cerebriforme]
MDNQLEIDLSILQQIQCNEYNKLNLFIYDVKMEFVPHNSFIDIEFVAEGGFIKIYKATWINGLNWNIKIALKELNASHFSRVR